jgi:hypothetical protein
MKQFGAVGPDVREQCSGQKAQQPDKVLLSIHQSNFSECLTLQVQLDLWQHNSGGAVGQVLQSPTLQVKEGPFSARVHDFQDECKPICCLKVEIVIVLARQGSGANFQPVNISSQSNRFDM